MNGYEPITGRHEQHATISEQIGRGFASSSACAHLTCLIAGPNRKTQMLEQCARVGFTPTNLAMLDDVFASLDVLEVSPCLNNLRLNISPS